MCEAPASLSQSPLELDAMVSIQKEVKDKCLIEPVKFSVLDLAPSLLSAFPCSYTGAVLHAAKTGDLSEVQGLYVKPADYDSAEAYFAAAQTVALLKKFNKDDMSSPQADEACWQKVKQREVKNAELNSQWESILAANSDLLESMRKHITRIFSAEFSLLEFYSDGRFGPGTSAGIRGTSPYSKVSDRCTVTEQARLMGCVLVRSNPHWDAIRLRSPKDYVDVVEGEQWSTVVKTALISRPIGIQPSLNVFLQLSIESFMTRCLQAEGLLCSDAQVVNQTLARLAIKQLLATIDLSSASESLYIKLIQYLFDDCPELLHKMEMTRCKYMTGTPEGTILLERFSAMGCGFTFPLLTSVLHSLCLATAELEGELLRNRVNHSVFGDDIIVPQSIAVAVCRSLESLGLTVNAEKSFLSGRFFESCGCDYFDGVLVRPLYITKELTNVQDTITLANTVFDHATRLGCNFGPNVMYRRFWCSIVRRLPVLVRATILRDPDPSSAGLRSVHRKRGRGIYSKLKSLEWSDGLAAVYSFHYSKWARKTLRADFERRKQFELEVIRNRRLSLKDVAKRDKPSTTERSITDSDVSFRKLVGEEIYSTSFLNGDGTRRLVVRNSYVPTIHYHRDDVTYRFGRLQEPSPVTAIMWC